MTPRPKTKNKTPDPRHAAVRELLDRHWKKENPVIPTLPWGPGEAGALGAFLRANPTLEVSVVETCLANRFASEDHAPAERIYLWIGDVLRYAAGPLNRFKQPMTVSSEATVGMSRPAGLISPFLSLREQFGEDGVARARAAHEAGYRPLQNWEINLLHEIGEL